MSAPGATDAARPRDRRVAWYVVAAVVAVVAVYVWTVSGGTWTHWRTRGAYYQKLADAFRHGQLHLLERPDPRLLTLDDAYEPDQNRPYKLHDASLYDGKYYLYWGPVPALLVVAANGALRVPAVPDQVLAFAFSTGTLVAAALLLLHLWRQHFRDAPGWTVPLMVVAAGLATPAPFNLGRAAIYEASIAASQMFFVAGLYLAVRALDRPAPSPVRLFLAGACLGCAVGSRASVAVAVAGVSVWIVWHVLRSQRAAGTGRRALVAALSLAFPVAVAGGALAAYNHARYGSPFELGIRLQLAAFNSPAEFDKLTSLRNVLPNLRTYLFDPVWRTGSTTADREAPAGLVLVAPLALLAAVAILPRRPHAGPAAGTNAGDAARGFTSLLAIGVPLLAAPALVLTPMLSSMRYQADWTTTVLLLAAIGFWEGCRRRASRPRALRVWLALGVVLVGATAGAGVAVAWARMPVVSAT